MTKRQNASSQSAPLHILKRYCLRPAIKRPTLSILFLHSCKNFPCSAARQAALYVRKSKPPLLYKDRADHRQGHGPWQPITSFQLTSLATDQTIRSTTGRERGVIYPSVMIAPQRFCGLTKTYLDHLAGVQTVSTNIFPRRSVSKHHKEQRSLENRFSGNRLAPNQRSRSRHPLLSSHECTSTHVRSRPRFLSLHIVCFLAVLAGFFFY